MQNTPRNRFTFCLMALAMTWVSSTAPAQQTLQRGDSFRIQSTIQRQTTVELAETAPTVSDVTDTFVIEYRVSEARPTGDMILQARVVKADRVVKGESGAVDQRQLPSLKNLTVNLLVEGAGGAITVSGHQNVLHRLLESHQSGRELISQSVTEDVFKSWVSQPFWIMAPQDGLDPEVEWDQIQDISLGLFGRLRTTATCKLGSTDAGITEVVISGNTSYRPGPAGSGDNSSAQLRFVNVTAKMDSFEGTGHFAPSSSTDAERETLLSEPDGGKPWFKDLSLKLSCSGTATAQTGKSERAVKFEMRQTQTMNLLPGYRIGRGSRFQMLIEP